MIVLAVLLAGSVIGLLVYAATGPVSPTTRTFNSPASGPAEQTGEAWTAHSTRTDTSTIEWSMPEPEFIDGPRPMASLDAVATYWVRGRGEPTLRYDVAVVDRVAAWTGDAATDASAIVAAIQEGASVGEPQRQPDGTTQLPFVGPYEGRTYVGTIVIADRVAVVVSVGYRDPADLNRAASDLMTMSSSVTVSPR